MKFENYLLIGIILLAAVFAVFEFMHIVMVNTGRTKVQSESNYWKWGVLYCNPSDPRIIVPKRIEWLGWTLNFAQPVSIIIIGGILVFITLSIIYAPSK